MDNKELANEIAKGVNQNLKEKQIAEQVAQYDETYKTHKRKILEQVRECNMKIVENANIIISLVAEEPINTVAHCMGAIENYRKRIAELQRLLDVLEAK